MNAWGVFQFLLNLSLVAVGVAIYVRSKRPRKDDPRLSKGLQLLQSKISILEDLSDRVDNQVKQLTGILDQKAKMTYDHAEMIQEHLNKVEKSIQKSLEVSKIFQDKIPHKEIIERQNTIKYIQAARMAHQGLSVEEISTQVDIPKSELAFIAKVNKDRLMFSEKDLPTWALESTEAPKKETTFSMPRDMTSVYEGLTLDKYIEEEDKKIEMNFKEEVKLQELVKLQDLAKLQDPEKLQDSAKLQSQEKLQEQTHLQEFSEAQALGSVQLTDFEEALSNKDSSDNFFFESDRDTELEVKENLETESLNSSVPTPTVQYSTQSSHFLEESEPSSESLPLAAHTSIQGLQAEARANIAPPSVPLHKEEHRTSAISRSSISFEPFEAPDLSRADSFSTKIKNEDAVKNTLKLKKEISKQADKKTVRPFIFKKIDKGM